MAGKITIYQVTNSGDVLGNIPSTRKFEMDLNDDVKIVGNHSNGYDIEGSRDVADNPIPDEALGEQQDTNLGEELYKFEIIITQRSNLVVGGTNVEAQKIEDFYQQDQENDNFPTGRIGIQLDDFIVKKLVPSLTKGGYIKYRKWHVDAELESPIFLTLWIKEGREA